MVHLYDCAFPVKLIMDYWISIIFFFLDIVMPLKPNFPRQTSIDETKSINKKLQPSSPLTHRPKFTSSLSSSVTSLNSSSSRSRASSMQESPLSRSSSNVSLSSNSPPSRTISSSVDKNSVTNRKSFVDRRKTVSGKIKPYILDIKTETKIKRLTMPTVSTEKRQSLKLNLIPQNQIRQTAKLGN
jgi:hypothetical protein